MAARATIRSMAASARTSSNGGAGNDRINGGFGNDPNLDFAAYTDAASGVSVSLRLQFQAQDTGGAGMDTLERIEGLIGSVFADTLVGDDGENGLIGNAGRDT